MPLTLFVPTGLPSSPVFAGSVPFPLLPGSSVASCLDGRRRSVPTDHSFAAAPQENEQEDHEDQVASPPAAIASRLGSRGVMPVRAKARSRICYS